MFALPETAQKVFDIVKVHLLTQNKRSEIGGSCYYRISIGGKELKCAAGVLIPEEIYSPKLEGSSWRNLVTRNDFPPEHCDLIGELQSVHDIVSSDDWETELARVAYQFNLKYY